MPNGKLNLITIFIIFGIVRDVFGSTCSWDVYHCDQEEFLCNKEESILLNSKRPLNREHCIAIKNTNEEKFNNYAIEVEMLSLESNEGKNSGYLGLVFNYVDLMNYDFVYLHSCFCNWLPFGWRNFCRRPNHNSAACSWDKISLIKAGN